jgi:hypothetical protein
MSKKQTKVYVVLASGQPLVAFRNQASAMDFAHSANEASRRLASPDPKQAPLWHTLVEVELRPDPKQGKI